MQTALTGAYCPQLAQPLRLPAFQYPDSDLSYAVNPAGVLVTFNGVLVAWIYPGHTGYKHTGITDTFFDVAYPTLTQDPHKRLTGIMLESDSFADLPAAVSFVEATFGGAA